MKKLLLLFALLGVLGFPIMGNAEVWISNAPQLGYAESSSVFFQEEFLSGNTGTGTLGTLGWQSTGGTVTQTGGTTDHPGLVRRDTSAVISTLTTINHLVGVATAWTQNEYAVKWIAKLNNNDANTTIRIGSMSSFLSNPPSDGVYFEKLDGDTNWFFVTRSGGSQTRTDTGVAVSTNWVTLTFEKFAASAYGYINATLVATNTTNLTNNGHAVMQMINSAAAAKSVDLDYCSIKLNITR